MKTAAYVDYQQRAAEFKVGDRVKPFWDRLPSHMGTVMAVWPAIGMVDEEWPHGSERLPVEDLQKMESKDYTPPEEGHDNVPGGVGTVRVPGGPKTASLSVARVTDAYVKKALYWATADRQYKATQGELDEGAFRCPKCKEGMLKKCVYKRRDGQSERLLGCPECLFLIKPEAILNHPEAVEEVA